MAPSNLLGLPSDSVGLRRMNINEFKTLSVPTAGKVYFGLGRNASYDAVKRGEIPVIRIGARLRVPVVLLERMLQNAGNAAA